MCEIMNKTLHSVFVTEEDFREPENIPVPTLEDGEKIEKISFQPEEILELLKVLDTRKAMGPNKVVG